MSLLEGSLRLDHFYLTQSPERLGELRFLEKALQGCRYQAVTSGRDRWEGVYPSVNIGSYFELLCRHSEGPSLGIAVSGARVQYVDCRRLKKELPHLPWRTQRRHWQRTKRPWFDAVSLRDPEGRRRPGFETWAMHYHFLHSEARRPVGRASIERFTRLDVAMGRDFERQVRFHSQWLPGRQSFGKASARLEIPDRDGGVFEVGIRWRRGSAAASLIALEGMKCPLVRTSTARSAHFVLDAAGGRVVLRGR